MGEAAWGVQFHPEFDAEVVTTYIEHYAERLRAEGQDPAALSAGCSRHARRDHDPPPVRPDRRGTRPPVTEQSVSRITAERTEGAEEREENAAFSASSAVQILTRRGRGR